MMHMVYIAQNGGDIYRNTESRSAMMPDDFFGIHVRDFVMGMQGGIANILAFRKLKLADIFATVIVGGLTANYLGSTIGEIIARYLSGTVSRETSHDLGVYFVGAAGGVICKGIVDMVSLRFAQKAEKK
jgi:hypothetical protein